MEMNNIVSSAPVILIETSPAEIRVTMNHVLNMAAYLHSLEFWEHKKIISCSKNSKQFHKVQVPDLRGKLIWTTSMTFIAHLRSLTLDEHTKKKYFHVAKSRFRIAETKWLPVESSI